MPTTDTTLPDGRRQFVLQPNSSLSPAQAKRFLWIVGAPMFALALYLSARGFWPVLPFAGLEFGVLVWALRASMRDSRRRETVRVDSDTIEIEFHDRAGVHRREFPRHWARITMRPPASRLHPARLCIESHGRSCELGRFLAEEERRALARRLRQVIGGVNASPPLG